ncbi:MAG: hypothetical protein MK078_03505 [Crocinitomicaceae bacterium]|nr:hypothetical protein [Crocinitomicaceae bacterium]
MKIWHCLFIGLGFIACSEEEPLEDTGAIMEYKVDEDSLTLANGGTLERDLSNEPEIIQDLFSLPNDILTDDYCYDREALLTVVVDGEEDEYGWHKYIIQEDDHYFDADNYECYSEISFKTFTREGKKEAFLSRMDKNFREFDYLEQDASGNWYKNSELPFEPSYADFFEELSMEEVDIVNEYGYYSTYLTASGDTVVFIFSEWEMGLRMGEKEVDEFNRDADYIFELFLSDGEFDFQRKSLKNDQNSTSILE